MIVIVYRDFVTSWLVSFPSGFVNWDLISFSLEALAVMINVTSCYYPLCCVYIDTSDSWCDGFF